MDTFHSWITIAVGIIFIIIATIRIACDDKKENKKEKE
jgi:hypothetical protein